MAIDLNTRPDEDGDLLTDLNQEPAHDDNTEIHPLEGDQLYLHNDLHKGQPQHLPGTVHYIDLNIDAFTGEPTYHKCDLSLIAYVHKVNDDFSYSL